MALPKFVWPAVAIVAAAGAILLSNREPVGPGGRPIVYDAVSYQRENAIARDLTLPSFKKAAEGEPVTDAEKAKLRAALPHLEAMNAYAPIKVHSYFAIGQIRQILGDVEEAGRAYEQAIANEPTDYEEKDNPDLKATVVEAKARLAETLLDYGILRTQSGATAAELKTIRERALSWAEGSVKDEPNNPRSLAVQASALLALGREEEAKAAVMAAAAVDRNHFKVRPLASLMGL